MFKIYTLVKMIYCEKTKEQEQAQREVAVEPSRLHEIILYNDDVNTFDHVIRTLIEVCEHTPEQAEQCSLIVHYKGKCSVKRGSYDELEPKCIRLHAAGLSAEIA